MEEQAASPAVAAVAAVEAERELVEIGVEVPVPDRAVAGAEPPPIEV